MHNKHYMHLGIMALLSFIAMFILMYSMVERWANVHPNLNQFYMAALMTAPMVIIEIVLMHQMFPNKTANIAIVAASVMALVVFFVAIRAQTAVGDSQFLRSMIPHHSGAILMCQRASIENAEIKTLCAEIVKGQQSEIDRMKTILAKLK
jgi:uncharacterized protein (DUF305 family)